MVKVRVEAHWKKSKHLNDLDRWWTQTVTVNVMFKNRIKVAWQSVKDLMGALFDAKIKIHLNGKAIKTIIRSVMMYGAETWTVMRSEEGLLERIEMRMLQWIPGASLENKKRNEVISETLEVACITDKIRGARLRWYGHVMRREDESCVKRIMTAEVTWRCSREQQQKGWETW